jgi:hypothetical protein
MEICVEVSAFLGCIVTEIILLCVRLSIFNIVSTAECNCSDGLQTEEHIYWYCKLYEDQRATMMDLLSENSKRAPKVSYRALKSRGKKIYARRL